MPFQMVTSTTKFRNAARLAGAMALAALAAAGPGCALRGEPAARHDLEEAKAARPPPAPTQDLLPPSSASGIPPEPGGDLAPIARPLAPAPPTRTPLTPA